MEDINKYKDYQGRVFKMYIDESGQSTYNPNPNTIIRAQEYEPERYLCLTGVIVNINHNNDFIVHHWNALKQPFNSPDADDPPAIFHYNDVVSRKGVFKKLKELQFRELFDSNYIQFLQDAQFTLCAVVLDTKTLKERRGKARNAYHYCLNVLLERYIFFLSHYNGIGSVFIESRGKELDRMVKNEFSHFYETGGDYLKPEFIQTRLKSQHINIQTKQARICGIEMADMLSSPMKHLVLKEYEQHNKLNKIDTSIVQILYDKIHTHPQSKQIKGFGIKFIA